VQLLHHTSNLSLCLCSPTPPPPPLRLYRGIPGVLPPLAGPRLPAVPPAPVTPAAPRAAPGQLDAVQRFLEWQSPGWHEAGAVDLSTLPTQPTAEQCAQWGDLPAMQVRGVGGCGGRWRRLAAGYNGPGSRCSWGSCLYGLPQHSPVNVPAFSACVCLLLSSCWLLAPRLRQHAPFSHYHHQPPFPTTTTTNHLSPPPPPPPLLQILCSGLNPLNPVAAS
jgi:hypothetical protein